MMIVHCHNVIIFLAATDREPCSNFTTCGLDKFWHNWTSYLSFAEIKIILNSFWILIQILYFVLFADLFFLAMNDILIFLNYKEVIIITDWVSYLLVYQAWAGIWPVMLIIHFLGKLQIKLLHCQPGFQTKYQNYNWLILIHHFHVQCALYCC